MQKQLSEQPQSVLDTIAVALVTTGFCDYNELQELMKNARDKDQLTIEFIASLARKVQTPVINEICRIVLNSPPDLKDILPLPNNLSSDLIKSKCTNIVLFFQQNIPNDLLENLAQCLPICNPAIKSDMKTRFNFISACRDQAILEDIQYFTKFMNAAARDVKLIKIHNGIIKVLCE